MIRKLRDDAWIAFILLLAGWKYTCGLEKILDIGLYDESVYLYRGVSLPSHGLPDAQHAPLYALWYFLLSLWRRDRIDLYYFNYKALAVILPIVIYYLLRRYKVSILPSVAVSFFFLISYANLAVWPKVSHFSLLVVLLSFALATYPKSPSGRLAVVVSGALLGSYLRPELFFAFILLSLFYTGFMLLKVRTHHLSDYIPFTLVVTLAGLLVAFLGLPLGSGGRAFSAFGQHFALNWAGWTGSHLNPWTNWKGIIEQNFGAIRSIPEAMISNPVVFAKHIVDNIMNIPRPLMDLLFVHASIFLPGIRNKIDTYLLVILLAIYVFFSRHRIISGLKSRIIGRKVVFLCFGCYLVPSLIAALVIFPSHHYLLLAGTLVLIAAALLLTSQEGAQSFTMKQLLLLSLIVIAILPPPSHLVGAAPRRMNVNTIEFVRSLQIIREVNLLEAEGGFHIYLPDNFHRVTEHAKDAGFNVFLIREKINMIVLTDKLKNDSRFRNDAEWRYFLDHYAALGYRRMYIPNTNRQLIIVEELLYR